MKQRWRLHTGLLIESHRLRNLTPSVKSLSSHAFSKQRSRQSHRGKATVQKLHRNSCPSLSYVKIDGKSPGVLYLPGFQSTMEGKKVAALEEYCRSVGHAFVRFDYSGCGASEGDPEVVSLTAWKRDALAVLDELTSGPQVLVGSSMGAGFAVLLGLARPDHTAAIIGISPTPDFPLSTYSQLTAKEKAEADQKGYFLLPSEYGPPEGYRIPLTAVSEAQTQVLLAASNSAIPLSCPVRFLCPLPVVPESQSSTKTVRGAWESSLSLAAAFTGTDVTVVGRKGADLRMCGDAELRLLTTILDDLIEALRRAR
uniref:palmitoyl-protein thioesterase ABHD10, mitochondrial isoform X2 n=1 Tax=Myxine glutinosa TaxID=7769 RepID=UPI00358F6514